MDHKTIDKVLVDSMHRECGDDRILCQFLLDLLFEEASHPGKWRWNNSFRVRIEKCAQEWQGDDENHKDQA
jgi:hypothetical protein